MSEKGTMTTSTKSPSCLITMRAYETHITESSADAQYGREDKFSVVPFLTIPTKVGTAVKNWQKDTTEPIEPRIAAIDSADIIELPVAAAVRVELATVATVDAVTTASIQLKEPSNKRKLKNTYQGKRIVDSPRHTTSHNSKPRSIQYSFAIKL